MRSMREPQCLMQGYCTALMRSMREPQCLMQGYCTVLEQPSWQCVHEGWSTETGNVSGNIDQDRNWPNWQIEVRLKPSWLSWKVYCCCNDVNPSLVEIMDLFWKQILLRPSKFIRVGRSPSVSGRAWEAIALPSRWMLFASVSWRLPYCVLVEFMFQFCFTLTLHQVRSSESPRFSVRESQLHCESD